MSDGLPHNPHLGEHLTTEEDNTPQVVDTARACIAQGADPSLFEAVRQEAIDAVLENTQVCRMSIDDIRTGNEFREAMGELFGDINLDPSIQESYVRNGITQVEAMRISLDFLSNLDNEGITPELQIWILSIINNPGLKDNIVFYIEDNGYPTSETLDDFLLSIGVNQNNGDLITATIIDSGNLNIKDEVERRDEEVGLRDEEVGLRDEEVGLREIYIISEAEQLSSRINIIRSMIGDISVAQGDSTVDAFRGLIDGLLTIDRSDTDAPGEKLTELETFLGEGEGSNRWKIYDALRVAEEREVETAQVAENTQAAAEGREPVRVVPEYEALNRFATRIGEAGIGSSAGDFQAFQTSRGITVPRTLPGDIGRRSILDRERIPAGIPSGIPTRREGESIIGHDGTHRYRVDTSTNPPSRYMSRGNIELPTNFSPRNLSGPATTYETARLNHEPVITKLSDIIEYITSLSDNVNIIEAREGVLALAPSFFLRNPELRTAVESTNSIAELKALVFEGGIFASRKRQEEESMREARRVYEQRLNVEMRHYEAEQARLDQIVEQALTILRNSGLDMLGQDTLDYILAQLTGSIELDIGVSFDKGNIDLASMNFGQLITEQGNPVQFAERIYRLMNKMMFGHPEGLDSDGNLVAGAFDLNIIRANTQAELYNTTELRANLIDSGVMNAMGMVDRLGIMRRITSSN